MGVNLERRIKSIEKIVNQSNKAVEVLVIGWEETDFSSYDYPLTDEEVNAIKGGSKSIIRWAE